MHLFYLTIQQLTTIYSQTSSRNPSPTYSTSRSGEFKSGSHLQKHFTQYHQVLHTTLTTTSDSTVRQQDYQPPKPEHQDLMDYLKCYLDSLQAHQGQHLRALDPSDTADYLTTLSRDYLSQPLPTSQGEVVAQQALRESSTSSSSSSSIADRPLQLMIGMLHNITEEKRHQDRHPGYLYQDHSEASRRTTSIASEKIYLTTTK